MALKDEPTLAQSDEGEAIIVVTSDATPTGKPRAVRVSKLREIQERVNPLQIRTERVLLAQYDLSGLASTSGANTLPNSHSFDDGYWLFEFRYRRGTNLHKAKVSAPTWNAGTRVLLGYFPSGGANLVHIWRENANAFRLFLERNGSSVSSAQTDTLGYLTAIYGEKIILERSKNG